MLTKIIQFSVKQKLIIGLFVIALIAYGSFEFTRLPIDAVPDITNNQVQVITSVPSLGAADIERLITFPVEQATINIPGITEQRSFSRFGLSIVTIVFDDHTDDEITCTDLDLSLVRLGFPLFHHEQESDQSQHT